MISFNQLNNTLLHIYTRRVREKKKNNICTIFNNILNLIDGHLSNMVQVDFQGKEVLATRFFP